MGAQAAGQGNTLLFRWQHPHRCAFCVRRASIRRQWVPGTIHVSRVKQESILKSREPSLSWIASLVVRVNTRQPWQLPREQRVKTAQLEPSPLLWQRLRKSHVAHVQQASFRRLLER